MEKFLKQILKIIVIIIHYLIIVFMGIGFLLPYSFLSFYIITWPSIYLHWQFNNGHCILTQLEYYLDDKPLPQTVETDIVFLKNLLNYLNIKIPNIIINYSNIYITIFWIIACIRYFIPVKI